jgi:isoquinoline 1-oxidoreductase subunit alpha
MFTLSINGKQYSVDVEPGTPLLWALRDTIGLTGTKYGCGIAQCGACTVHVGGEATRACITMVETIGAAEITTIEGIVARPNHPVVEAWMGLDVPQCGYCQPGQIMAATALLANNPSPSDEDISREMVNICRCGTYHDIRAAVHKAARAVEDGASL